MARTLMIYDERNPLLEKAADVAGCFAALVQCVPPSQTERMEEYRNLVVVCDAERGPSDGLLQCLVKAKEQQPVSLLMVGGLCPSCRTALEQVLGRPLAHCATLERDWLEADGFCDALICAARDFMAAVDGPIKPLPREALKARIDEFILSHDACALACVADGFVRNTALDFRYVDGNFYILSEGGQKFQAILRSPNVSLLIYDSPKQGGNVTSLQVTGRARRLPMWSEEYVKALEKSWNNVERCRSSLVRLNVIEIIPERMEYFSYTLKPDGVDLKETYIPG